MVDKNGKTLFDGDKIRAEYTLLCGGKIERTGVVRHVIKNKKTGVEFAFVTIDNNILCNMFLVTSDRIEKIDDGRE